MALITLCAHCGTQCSGKFCPDCTTAPKRRDMDEANRKNFEENKLPPYECGHCTGKTNKEKQID